MTPEEAIKIVAERAIWAAADNIDWVDYGDIGHLDWVRVLDEIKRQVEPRNLELYQLAYDLLASRATGEVSP